ncbi:mitochondrial antiviral-signaling protein-like isoform X2 [Lepisosteus oculatus]|uniref:mitochondrial antiviral-signaling protein-like isoform X2 n=1 Tax=Lepisosteus oculatus TaxID=7918 RepID=UPI0035F5293B
MTFVSDKLYKEYLRLNMEPFVSKVKPMEILPFLYCLTESDKEEIVAKKDSSGDRVAMQHLLDCLRRRENWPPILIHALEGTEQSILAQGLKDKYESLLARYTPRQPRPPAAAAGSPPPPPQHPSPPTGDPGPFPAAPPAETPTGGAPPPRRAPPPAPAAALSAPQQEVHPSVASPPLPVQSPVSTAETSLPLPSGPPLPPAAAAPSGSVAPPVCRDQSAAKSSNQETASPAAAAHETVTPAKNVTDGGKVAGTNSQPAQGITSQQTPQVKTRPAAIDPTTIPLFPSSTGASANPYDGEFLSKPGTLHSFAHAQVLHAANYQVDHPPIPEELYSGDSARLQISSSYTSCSDCNRSAGASGQEPHHNEPEENHFSSFENTVSSPVQSALANTSFAGAARMPMERSAPSTASWPTQNYTRSAEENPNLTTDVPAVFNEFPETNRSTNVYRTNNELHSLSLSDVRENVVRLFQPSFADNYAGQIRTSLESSPDRLRGPSESREPESGGWGGRARDLLGNHYVQAIGIVAVSFLLWRYMRKWKSSN